MEAIIFLIIAAIVGMVNNKKKTEQTEPKPVQKTQTAQSGTEDRRPRNARESMDRAANELQKEYERQREAIEASKPKHIPRDSSIQPSAPRPDRERTVREKKKTAPQADLHLDKGLSQNDLVRGVVMAEILGPPRAKRSHARSRM